MNFVLKGGTKIIVIWLLLRVGSCNLRLCNDLGLFFKHIGLITKIEDISIFHVRMEERAQVFCEKKKLQR